MFHQQTGTARNIKGCSWGYSERITYGKQFSARAEEQKKWY